MRIPSSIIGLPVPCLPVACLFLAAWMPQAQPQPSRPGQLRPLTEIDLRWLDRVTFGIDSATVARYRQLGRAAFLAEQLKPPPDDPPELKAAIAEIPVTQRTAEDLVRTTRAEQQRINKLSTDEEKQQARTAFNQAANQATYETARRHLMRALHSPAQLREQMTWFWMNHFNVFVGKGTVRWTLPEYEERHVRVHALGRFRDLVLATVTSPAMLEYLDNAQSAAGRINENYARELMELHTLGVSGGPSGSRYSQQDVQELARVLTGLGINPTENAPKLPPDKQPFYVRRGLVEFNPARHDFGAKTILGHPIAAKGLPEVDEAVTLLCRQPATARFISRKLATYFVADEPPAPLVESMARTFQRSDGDIAAVLRTMFQSSAFLASVGGGERGASAGAKRPDKRPADRLPADKLPADKVAADKFPADKFKDPLQFVVSSLRLAYDGKAFTNYRPIVSWLTQLGQPLYGRVSPDGYALTEAAWTSSGQMVKRFEMARAIGSGSAGLFNTDDNKPGPNAGFPMLTNRLFYEAIEPTLSARTRDALGRTTTPQEWNTLLLASPEWMQR